MPPPLEPPSPMLALSLDERSKDTAPTLETGVARGVRPLRFEFASTVEDSLFCYDSLKTVISFFCIAIIVSSAIMSSLPSQSPPSSPSRPSSTGCIRAVQYPSRSTQLQGGLSQFNCFATTTTTVKLRASSPGSFPGFRANTVRSRTPGGRRLWDAHSLRRVHTSS